MKKKELREIEVEIVCCDICGKELSEDEKWQNSQEAESTQYKNRVHLIRGLFKTANFDAHIKCVNSVVREAFNKYIK